MNGPHPLDRLTVHLDRDFAERVKNAAAARGQSVARFLVNAIVTRTMREEQQFNGGQPFPQRPKMGGAAA